MKVFISTDLEGISGVVYWDQTRDRTHPLYAEARHLLTADINACAEGCFAGGATEVLVSDGHGGGFNIVPDELHSGIEVVTGPGRPAAGCGMEEGFDGLIMLGYHAMNGVEDGMMHHTQSSAGENKYWYNGVESGELVQTALVAGYYDIPPIMVTGDVRACEEAVHFFGDKLVTVAVKKGYSRTSGKIIAPKKARKMIRKAAKKAMSAIPKCKPYKLDLPITCRMQLRDKAAIGAIVRNGRSQRVDEFTVERVTDDPRDIYRF